MKTRRALDIVLASSALLLAGIPLLVAMIAIKLTDPGPVFYKQARIGWHGRPFWFYKLRTMRVGVAGPKVTAARDPRISTVGRVLRQLKIDELPQLWNVVRGDMGVIGPRPEVPRFVARYSRALRPILEAKPGLASMSTLVYASEARELEGHPAPEQAYIRHIMPLKISADLKYERTRTLWSDVRLMWALTLSVFGRNTLADREFSVPTDVAPPTHGDGGRGDTVAV